MKYGELTRAMNAVRKLSAMDMPTRDAYKIFKLNRSMETICAFCQERERGLIDKYGATVESDGTIRFGNGGDDAIQEKCNANMEAFIKEINDFHNTEAEADFSPVTLQLDTLAGQKIAPADIAALEGIVEFE